MHNKQKVPPTSNAISCPECSTPIRLSSMVTKGEIVECRACGIESEIIATNPLSLAPLEEEK